jgi:nucleoid-associated protein YgaU
LNKHIIAVVCIASISTSAIPVLAQDICETHTITQGETLREIAEEAYGNPSDYRYIFDANRAKFGISPHIISVGTTLDLPCR